MNKRNVRFAIEVIVLVIVWLLCLVAFRDVKGQDLPVNTFFTISCEQGDPTQITFIVQSDGVEDYAFSTFGDAGLTTIPSHFTTHAGKYMLGWLDGSSFNVEAHFTNKDGIDAVMPIGQDYFTWCDHDAILDPVEPSPTDTPEQPADCPATRMRPDSGEVYCYVPSASGLIPIPPPLS